MSDDPQRRLILHMSVSLDGFVARTDGVIDWLAPRDGGAEGRLLAEPLRGELEQRPALSRGARGRDPGAQAPVALGDGLGLMLGLPEPQRFELVSATTYADGCVSKVLQPA